MMTEERLEGKKLALLHDCRLPGTLLEGSQISHLTHTNLGRCIIYSHFKDAETKEQSLVSKQS